MKKFTAYIFKISIIAVLCFSFAHSADAATLARPANNLGLVGYWTFDGGDMVPNVRDRSGNGYHGNLFGQTSTSTRLGKIGQALHFDNTDDYVQITNFSWPGGPVTVSYWNYVPSRPDANASGFGLQTECANRFQAHSPWVNDGLYWDYGDCSGSGRIIADYSPYYGKWTYVTLVSTGQGGNFKAVYFDGVLVNSNTDTITTGPGASANFSIGSYYDGSSARVFHYGTLDDFRIYNRVLSAGEIKNLYLATQAKFSTSKTPTGLQNGLLAHWTFDGADMTPNVRDKSGQGNHGNLIGQTSTTTGLGKSGQALSFDGSDDYIQIPTVAFPTYPTGGNTTSYDASFSIWFKTTSGGVILSQNDGTIPNSTPTGFVPVLYIANSGTIYGSMFWHNATTNQNTSSSGYNDGQWHHLVNTYTNGTESMYVDGSLVDTQSMSQYGYSGSGYYYFLGTGYAGGSGWEGLTNWTYFSGSLDDMRIYNRALSASEIKQLYAMGGSKVNTSQTVTGSGLTSGLVGWWTFDGKEMTPNVRDKSGNTNHGYLVNTSTTTVIGKLGQAMSFDGTVYNSNIYVRVPDSSSLDLNGSAATFSLWVKPKQTSWPSQYTSLIAKRDGGSNEMFELYLEPSTGNLGFYNTSLYTTVYAPPTNVWTHLALTISQAGVCNFYAEGNFIFQYTSCGFDTNNDSDVTIGSYVGPGNDQQQYIGVLDDVRIYNRELSATEIKQLSNLGK